MSRGIVWYMTRAGGDERAFFVWGETILIVRKRGREANLEREVYEYPTVESAHHSMVWVTDTLERHGYLLVVAPTVVSATRRRVEDTIKEGGGTLWGRVHDLIGDTGVPA